MALLECASTVEICAIRATRLETDGTVDYSSNNVYIVQDLIQLQVTPNIREGEEREMIGGCGGCVIASKTDDDNYRRFDLELQAGRLEPGFIEMMTGGVSVDGTDGPVGVMLGAKRACGIPQPIVAFEAWTKRWTADDEQDPVYPWWHWVWPATKWILGQNTLQGDFGPVVLTGKSRVNTSWAEGPFGDQAADLENNLLGIFGYPGDLPEATCDYSSVGT